MRHLNESFIFDLQEGKLSKLLRSVKTDGTLCLEIRNNYLNIYYRGGSLLRVSQKNDKYLFYFDTKYCLGDHDLWASINIDKLVTIDDYIDAFPLMKRDMDYWFFNNPKLEREFQQLILRENNLEANSASTDYFIADIEYANSLNGSRFDMVGVKWLSSAASRKNEKSASLALLEVKYGDGAMTGSAGIVKHFCDIEKFIKSGNISSLYSEAEAQFNQKVSLGLINGIDTAISIDITKKPEFILICANHKPASSVLLRELKTACDKYPGLLSLVDVKIAFACNMGYGLYANKMVEVNEYLLNMQGDKYVEKN